MLVCGECGHTSEFTVREARVRRGTIVIGEDGAVTLTNVESGVDEDRTYATTIVCPECFADSDEGVIVVPADLMEKIHAAMGAE